MKRMLPAVLAILGAAAVAAAVVRGEASLGLFLVFPVVYGTGGLLAVGVLLLMAAGVAWFFTRPWPSAAEWDARPDRPQPPPELWADESPVERSSSRTKWGGLALIGPFPIAWGSDRTALVTALALGLALALVMLVLMLVLRAA